MQTFSIIGYDPTTISWGVAVASKWIAVGSAVPFARAHAGAIATQSYTNSTFGPKGLAMLAEGKSAQDTLDALLKEDDGREKRQVGIVDLEGRVAAFTGNECIPEAGSLEGKNCTAQGNTLPTLEVLSAMTRTFEHTKGDLAHRLYKALLAGEEAGGDKRGKQSSALYVVRRDSGHGAFGDKVVDLRVDDHPEPVRELGRLLKIHDEVYTSWKGE